MPTKKHRPTISQSKLNQGLLCPAQLDYGRKFEPLTSDVFLEDGNTAHQMMAGVMPKKFSTRSRNFYEALKSLYTEKGYKPLWIEDGKPVVERRQHVILNSNLSLVRIIDAFAIAPDGEPVLIDWKTAVWPWSQVKLGNEKPLADYPVPQAHGFQSIAYLLPPDEKVPFKWPTRIDFVVAAEKGNSAIHTYRYNHEDEVNFLNAVEMVVQMKKFPKHRGSHCTRCQFAAVCFNLPGWELMYERKSHAHKK